MTHKAFTHANNEVWRGKAIRKPGFPNSKKGKKSTFPGIIFSGFSGEKLGFSWRFSAHKEV